MSVQTSPAAPAEAPAATGERITYGAVHLEVTEPRRSLVFWRDVVGLAELESGDERVSLGVGGRELVVLHRGAVRPAGRGHAGLYHLALHVPDAREFARALIRISDRGVQQSPTDHIFSKATYLNDPDGILLEVTLETPERFRSVEMGGPGLHMIDSEGRRRGGTEPLDVGEALAALDGADPDGALKDGAYIGHVHLHVGDLRAANDFYRDVVGFSDHAFMSSIGMADLSAGGAFPHRIAVNDWHGPHAVQAPPGTAGMRHFELRLSAAGELERLAARAQRLDGALRSSGSDELVLLDPAGNELRVTEAAR